MNDSSSPGNIDDLFDAGAFALFPSELDDLRAAGIGGESPIACTRTSELFPTSHARTDSDCVFVAEDPLPSTSIAPQACDIPVERSLTPVQTALHESGGLASVLTRTCGAGMVLFRGTARLARQCRTRCTSAEVLVWSRATRARVQGGSARVSVSVAGLRRVYPMALFLSGVAAGAVLVSVTRLPSEEIVTADAAPRDRLLLPAARSPIAEVSTLTPITLQQEPPSRPVSTAGLGARRRSVRSAPPQQRAAQSGPYRGSVAVTSRPQGADVFINGQKVGTTPLELRNLPVGSRAVRLVLDGHETWSRAIDVVANQRTTVAAALQETRRR